MFFIGNKFDLKMFSGSDKVAICHPTDLDDIKKKIIEYGKVISIFEDKEFCSYIIKNHLKIDESIINMTSSSFLKTRFLRSDDVLFYIDCEKPTTVGHLKISIDDENNTSAEFTGRTEEIVCYTILIK